MRISPAQVQTWLRAWAQGLGFRAYDWKFSALGLGFSISVDGGNPAPVSLPKLQCSSTLLHEPDVHVSQ